MENQQTLREENSYLKEIIRNNEKRYGTYGRNVSWIVERYGKYGGKASRIVKRNRNYERKVSWIIQWKDFENTEDNSKKIGKIQKKSKLNSE